jgi:hypothetical protein
VVVGVAGLVGVGCQQRGGGGAGSVSGWIGQLKDQDPKKRREASEKLRLMGSKAESAVPDLVRMLEGDEDAKCREYAADALAGIGEASVAELFKGIKSTNAETRAWCWHALGTLSPAIKDKHLAAFKAELPKAVRDEESKVSIKASFAYKMLNAQAHEIAPSMIEVLKSSNEKYVRCYIMEGFQMYGEHTRMLTDAIPVLRELMQSPDEQTRGLSTGLLRMMGELKDEKPPGAPAGIDEKKGPPGGGRFAPGKGGPGGGFGPGKRGGAPPGGTKGPPGKEDEKKAPPAPADEKKSPPSEEKK